MGEYNETTARVLDVLSKKPSTVDALAKSLECSRSNVTVILLKLLKFGRVDRKKVRKGEIVIRATNPPVTRDNLVFVYSITDSGLDRLERISGSGDAGREG
jgi:predicted transcriptional regulator